MTRPAPTITATTAPKIGIRDKSIFVIIVVLVVVVVAIVGVVMAVVVLAVGVITVMDGRGYSHGFGYGANKAL